MFSWLPQVGTSSKGRRILKCVCVYERAVWSRWLTVPVVYEASNNWRNRGSILTLGILSFGPVPAAGPRFLEEVHKDSSTYHKVLYTACEYVLIHPIYIHTKRVGASSSSVVFDG